MQSRIIVIGESLLDILFRDGQPLSATPGGSMLNVSLSLGRLGLRVTFVTELGEDQPGDIIRRALADNGVDTSFVGTLVPGKTPVALAFLDDKGDAFYDFYKLYPPDRLSGPLPRPAPGDILLFGSFFAVDPAIRPALMPWLRSFHGLGLNVYDPNIRTRSLDSSSRLKALFEENAGLSDIVKGSDEDFMTVYGTADPERLFPPLRERGCFALIVTRGPDDVLLVGEGLKLSVPVPPLRPVSTIGAGDAFNAGLLFGLTRLGIDRERLPSLTSQLWAEILGAAVAFSAEVCLSRENAIGREFAAKIAQERGAEQ